MRSSRELKRLVVSGKDIQSILLNVMEQKKGLNGTFHQVVQIALLTMVMFPFKDGLILQTKI